jgi:hypothetical protein
MLQGTVALWHWIGDDAATTFSYRPCARAGQRAKRWQGDV